MTGYESWYTRALAETMEEVVGEMLDGYVTEDELEALIREGASHYDELTREFRREHGLTVRVGRPRSSIVAGLGGWA